MGNGHSDDLTAIHLRAAKETHALLKQRARRKHKLSQMKIAISAGVSQKWVSLFERGKLQDPGYRNLAKLREFLDGLAA